MTFSIKVATNTTNATNAINQLQIVTNRLNAQSRVSRMLARAKTLNSAVEETLKILCETFSWRFGEYWTLDKLPGSLRQTLCWESRQPITRPTPTGPFSGEKGFRGEFGRLNNRRISKT